ncbi:polysaccharide deacetylase family protein [Azoarcus indigens]|uniref:Peptidoglycan/xylan/chitin deacetylase (PgdA/CDA1 family) n=1 Tax=Azoarcus indigens TaxID=29545 RepID=A0A4R6DS15_9RHOO|nr:polysaccharide deacetylase family protein [Azoarcus indigens]NMG66601.1 polysaccharide deacetylase family protein [Azoarcus indigens]TDN47098.1 peptidoglycan/xylan/chitin deacetylase (PgdA/CDA1 family) [Azoarcus indigens]
MISAAPSPRRWRPSPLLHAACAAHVGAAAALAFAPQAWPAALGAVVLSHAALTAAGLWPRSRLLGPNWSRLPEGAIRRGEIAITIDDGPDPEVTPPVLDLLDAAGARATFFCIGEQAVAHPRLVKEIVRRGHAVENHSQHHRHHFSLFGPRRLESDILAAQMLFRTLTGHTPCFFRAPAGLRNPFLEPILARQGLLLASWTRRGFDTRESRADVVLQRLTQNLAAGDILLLHDGHAARTAAGRPVIVEVLPVLLQRIAAAGLKPVTLRSTLQ